MCIVHAQSAVYIRNLSISRFLHSQELGVSKSILYESWETDVLEERKVGVRECITVGICQRRKGVARVLRRTEDARFLTLSKCYVHPSLIYSGTSFPKPRI